MQVDWIEGREGLNRLIPEWRELSHSPFTTPDWFFAWWEAFAAGRQLVTCTLRREGQLVALSPLIRHPGRLTAPVNDHSPCFDLVAADQDARVALAEELIARAPVCLALDALPADSLSRSVLASRDRARTVTRTRDLSPIVDTDTTYERFRELTRHNWGAPLERFRRKMIRENDASFHLLEQPADLDSILRRGYEVEASGWKGSVGTAITSHPGTERFYTRIAHSFAERGQLALSWLDYGDEMVAFDFCLLAEERLYLLKTGFDERHRRLAPGLVLRLAVIERCIERGLAAHELLGGDDAWKQKFSSSARVHVELRLYGRNPRGSLAWAYRRSARPLAAAAARKAFELRRRRRR